MIINTTGFWAVSFFIIVGMLLYSSVPLLKLMSV